MRRRLRLSLALAALLLPWAVPLPAGAQSGGSSSIRATNVARMKAESLNGGLQVYRAAACMHQQSGGSCLIRSSANGFLFRFFGGGPGWQQTNQPPSVETEILVSPDGRSVLEVIYNGKPR